MDSLPITTTTTTTTETEMPLPPPYTPSTNPFISPAEEEEEEEHPSTNITFNSPVTIHGSNNIVSFPSLDLIRMAATIIATVSQKAGLEPSKNTSIQVNYGVTVIGDKNVVGSVGIRPLGPRQQQGQQAATVAAAPSGNGASFSLKRKAEEVYFDVQSP
jgi:hypothetical protein